MMDSSQQHTYVYRDMTLTAVPTTYAYIQYIELHTALYLKYNNYADILSNTNM